MSKDDKHCKPGGPVTEFFLSANGQYKKGERIPIKVNGYEYYAEVGRRNKLPKEVVQVLQNAKSSTVVPDLSRTNPDRGGMPRKQEEFFNPSTTVDYQSDFDVEILGEK